MGFAHADQISTIVAGATSATVTLPLAVSAKDLLAAIIRTSDATLTAANCHDNVNGNWTITGTTSNVSEAYFLVSGSAAANGLTLTVAATTSGTMRIAMDRFTTGGLAAAFGTSATHGGQSSTSGDCGTIAGDPGNRLIYGGYATGTNVTGTAGTSNGVAATIGVQASGTNGCVFSEYVLSTTSGTQTLSFTVSATPSGLNAWEATFSIVADNFPVGYDAPINQIKNPVYRM